MKRQLIILVSVLCITNLTLAQETDATLKFRDLSFSLGVPYIDDNLGLQLSLSTTVAAHKNLFKAYFGAGSEASIFGDESNIDNFQEIDLMYGRQLVSSETVWLELYGGVGYFIADKNLESDSVVGFPIQLDLVFPTSRKLIYGVEARTNINSFMPIYSLSFLLKYQF